MQDLNALLTDLAKSDKGVAFILFPISGALLADFPVPRSSIVEEFLNFSEDPSSEHADPHQFNPALHLFRLTEANLLMLGMVGQRPGIYEWAQDWLEHLQAEERYATSLRHAVLKFDHELLGDEPAETAPAEDDPFKGTPLEFTPEELDANEADLEDKS